MPGAISPDGLEASGMPPQIRAIEALATDKGWKETCRGRSGEEQVVRLLAPGDISEQAIEEFSDRVLTLAPRISVIDVYQSHSEVCNLEPGMLASDSPASSLAFGLPEELEPLKVVAIDCGFTSTLTRQWRPADSQLVQKKDGWAVLDAGEDAISRYGPLICFGKLSWLGNETQNVRPPPQKPPFPIRKGPEFSPALP